MPAKKKTKTETAAKETAVSKTETNPDLDEVITAEESGILEPDSSLPQTETDSEPKARDEPEDGVENTADSTVPQTEMDSEEKAPNSPEADIGPKQNTGAPQTETKIEDNPAIASEGGVEGEAETSISQTDSELESNDSEGIEDSADNSQKSSQSDTDESKSNSDTAEPLSRRRKRLSSARATPVVTIDDIRTVETEADKAKSDLLDLLESQKTGKILSGTIQGIERSADNSSHSLAVIYHGDFKVIIPANEAIEPPEDYRGMLPEDVLHYMLTKRLGAEVDYIVKGIDPNAGIAAASRLDAMRAKRRQYYFGTDRDGNNLLHSGICAEARVVSVIRAGIFVDLFGSEIYIPLRELSYQRWMDAAAHFQPGQRILVKILEIDRKDRNNVKVSVSVKQAGENPYEKALRRYSVGNRYVGTVSMVDTNGVFVALDGGIDCLCSYPKRGRPPRGARVTVRILGINNESNRIWGAITHIAAAR